MFDREKIANLVMDLFKDYRYETMRLGQVTFCAVFILYPSIANQLTASDFDPFYDDNKTDSFLNECERIFNEKENNNG